MAGGKSSIAPQVPNLQHTFKRQLPKIFLLLFERSRAPSFARERGEKEEQGGGSKQSSPISDRSEFQSNGQGNLAEWNRQLFPLLGRSD
jgi:hypothetical protein